MRYLLSMVGVVCATVFACHGIFTEDEAADALEGARSEVALRQVVRQWPYGASSTEARTRRLALWKDEGRTATGEATFPMAWAVVEGDINLEPNLDAAPWLGPAAAGSLGLVLLLLAAILPGTRFRGLSLLILLGGAAALLPSLMEPGRQVELMNAFDPVTHTLTQVPRIAMGLLVAGALTLGFRRSPTA
jgi:hypothetical protein